MYELIRDGLYDWLWADGAAVVAQAAAWVVACWVFGVARRMIDGRSDGE